MPSPSHETVEYPASIKKLVVDLFTIFVLITKYVIGIKPST